MEILKVEKLSKHYGEGKTLVKALDEVNLAINKGEFIAIIGASGSGKSTLLHLLGGVDTPTSGKVFLENQDIYSFNDDKLSKMRRNEVGLVYQFYNLIPILTAKENVILPVMFDNKNVDENYLDELINLLNLNNRLEHLPNQLSGGEQQRVAIARGLINKPKVLLLDEPTGNLDSKRTDEILNLLKLVNEKYQQTIIMVTHDLNLAKEAKRLIKMEDGKIKSDELVK